MSRPVNFHYCIIRFVWFYRLSFLASVDSVAFVLEFHRVGPKGVLAPSIYYCTAVDFFVVVWECLMLPAVPYILLA